MSFKFFKSEHKKAKKVASSGNLLKKHKSLPDLSQMKSMDMVADVKKEMDKLKSEMDDINEVLGVITQRFIPHTSDGKVKRFQSMRNFMFKNKTQKGFPKPANVLSKIKGEKESEKDEQAEMYMDFVDACEIVNHLRVRIEEIEREMEVMRQQNARRLLFRSESIVDDALINGFENAVTAWKSFKIFD
jgi:hypothetical protein